MIIIDLSLIKCNILPGTIIHLIDNEVIGPGGGIKEIITPEMPLTIDSCIIRDKRNSDCLSLSIVTTTPNKVKFQVCPYTIATYECESCVLNNDVITDTRRIIRAIQTNRYKNIDR